MTPPSRYVKPDEAQKIIALRRKGLGVEAIAQQVGRPRQTITLVLKRGGVASPRAEPRLQTEMERRIRGIAVRGRKGMGEREIAAAMGLTVPQVRKTIERYDLTARYGQTSSADLAEMVGVSRESILKAVKDGRLAAGRWLTRYAFSDEQVEAALAHYAGHRTSRDLEGWLTASQVARELGVSVDMLHVLRQQGDPRVLGIRRVQMTGGDGRAFRYEPRGVIKAAAQFPKRNLPLDYKAAGLVQSKALGQLANRNYDAVNEWARAGAPHHRDRTRRGGRIWWRVSEVLPWLDAQTDWRLHRAAASIRRNLAGQQGRAA